MAQNLLKALAWLCLCFIAFVTIGPIQARPTITAPHGFEHLAAFAVLGFVFSLAYPRHIATVLLIVFGSAIGLELLQLITPDRHGQVRDAMEKLVGGFVGVIVGQIVLRFEHVRRHFSN